MLVDTNVLARLLGPHPRRYEGRFGAAPGRVRTLLAGISVADTVRGLPPAALLSGFLPQLRPTFILLEEEAPEDDAN